MESILKDAAARKSLLSPKAFVEFPEAECHQPVHHRFEQIAIRHANAPAVRLNSGDITYGELNTAANQAARMLLAQIGCDSRPVALMLDQGFESVLWTLAVLKAGLCYAPLDQRLPQRVLYPMIEDLRPAALIVGARHQETVRNFAANHCRVISADASRAHYSRENLHRPVAASNIVCIFYTSGSTGEPKGVADCHRNVLHNILRYTNTLKFSPGDILSLVQNPSFSGTVSSLFGALLNGAAIAPFDLTGTGLGALSQWLRRARITVFHAVPSIFRQLSGVNGGFPDVRLIRLEGDRASARDIQHFRANFAETCTLVNGFGATECGLVRQFFIDQKSSLDANECVPVGYPVPDTEIKIVDEQGLSLPSGSVGEILVGSRFLATGYWRDSARTAERFKPADNNSRHYKTGDLGRMDDDGCLIHLGRADQRIRIAGEFVDATEIENALNQVPGIFHSMVQDFVDPFGDRRLCAYVVAEPSLTVHRLRKILSERIPKHNVPSAFVFLDALPLSRDLKVDYRSLPQPGWPRHSLPNAYVAPRNPTENSLTKIWARLLGVDRVGICDNFFDLGGDSLLAVRLIAEVETEFKRHVSSSAIFQDPTIEDMARLLDQEQTAESTAFPVVIQPQGSNRPLFCVHEFFGDVLCYLNLARYLGRDQPLYALEAVGLRDGAEPLESIESMAAAYVKQMQQVQPHGPYAVGGLSLGGVIAFEIARQLRARGEAVAMLALLDSAIRLENSQLTWKRVTVNLFQDLPSWVRGSLQLTRRQWTELIKMKLRVMQPRRPPASGLSGKHDSPATDGDFVSDLADMFGFSENHKKVARAQQKAWGDYRPRNYPGKITLFRARMQPFFSSHEREKGWKTLAEGGVDVIDVPGNHLGMLQEPHVRVLARELGRRLNACDREPPERSTRNYPAALARL